MVTKSRQRRKPLMQLKMPAPLQRKKKGNIKRRKLIQPKIQSKRRLSLNKHLRSKKRKLSKRRLNTKSRPKRRPKSKSKSQRNPLRSAYTCLGPT